MFLGDHWIALAVTLAVIAALAWIAPPIARDLQRRFARRRAAYRASEAFAFARLRAAARRGDATQTYFALLGWLARFTPIAPERTVAALLRTARDPALEREIASLEHKLFGPPDATHHWSARGLTPRIVAARQDLRRRAVRAGEGTLPRELNPVGTTVQERLRAVAR